MKKARNVISFSILILVVLLSTSCFSLMSAAGASSTDNNVIPTITIVNRTGYTIWYVYISPTTDQYWGDDWLRSDQVLRNNESVTLQLREPLSRHRRYDIRLTDNEGDDYIKMNVPISNNSRIVFNFSDISY